MMVAVFLHDRTPANDPLLVIAGSRRAWLINNPDTAPLEAGSDGAVLKTVALA